jgi:hypothetical protein
MKYKFRRVEKAIVVINCKTLPILIEGLRKLKKAEVRVRSVSTKTQHVPNTKHPCYLEVSSQ